MTLLEEIELIKHFFLSSDVHSVLQGIHVHAVFLRHQRNDNISVLDLRDKIQGLLL